MAGAATFGVCSLLVTLTINMLTGWDLDAMCPGTDEFCGGIYWQTVADYLGGWLFIGQLVVVLALASPFALVRFGR